MRYGLPWPMWVAQTVIFQLAVEYFDPCKAVISCANCPPSLTCALENQNLQLFGGNNTFPLRVCNWDALNAAAYQFTLSLSIEVSCDTARTTIPKVKTATASDACSITDCTLLITLAENIDWAIALRFGAGVNKLLLTVSGPKALQERVTVGTLNAQTGPTVTPSPTTHISVCATRIFIKGTRFSRVPSCNVVQLCSGVVTSSNCESPIQKNLSLVSVSCVSENCAAEIQLTARLSCNLANPSSKNSLYAVVHVGDAATLPGAAVIGNVIPPIVTITNVDVGNQAFRIFLQDVCLVEEVLLINRNSTNQIIKLQLEAEESNTSTNVINITLSDLSPSLIGSYDVEVAQCGIRSNFYPLKTRAKTLANTDTPPQASSNQAITTITTQKMGKTESGLSFAAIIGIVLASLGVIGFIVEWRYHVRKVRVQRNTDFQASE
uniref:Uncharacterized protein AlNc14C4G543 n=1 Tax=Albugo laibachii Nc14 TaxID=890382 RepID=F0W0A1_9STRA|nr:conserved hypothetical protein [Albugo laibachii Nc14]|eukprot:CCA14472.1 conserved hypothetical protein [Albugo laibachii Nc14]